MFTEQLLYTLGSVIIVSLISFIGVVTLFLKKNTDKYLIYFISFSAGALFGDTFIHIFPEIAQSGLSLNSSLYVLAGIFAFFVLEKLINWRHCHSKEHKHTIAYTNLIGDGLHNFIDGAIIAASYLISVPLGIATTLAVIFHEIPQEIGDFAVLTYSLRSKKKALIFNFISALTAVVGSIIVLFASSSFDIQFLLPITAGGFIYIAGSDLIPELHKEMNIKRNLVQVITFLIGIGLMWLLLSVE